MKEIVPADRIKHVQEYYFSRKLREVAELNAKGLDIISLGIGGPDLPPAKSVVDTLCTEALDVHNHSYQLTVGLPELRKAYAKWYENVYGVELDPISEIQPLIGSKEGILQISLAFLNPGDGVLVPNPGYPTYTSASWLAGADVFYYDLKEENNWQPDFNQLEAFDLSRIKLMWVNYPHMPTGAQANMETFARLIKFAKENGIVLVNDNPYSFILNEHPRSILEIQGAKEIAIEMNSLSKSHNMAGWRMAMLASNAQFIQWIIKVKSNIDSGQFKPMMLAAVKALELPAKWYKDLNAIYSERRNIAEKIMEELGCRFDTSQRGLFLWGKIPDEETSSEAFADKVLYNARVFITPGFIFGSNGNRYIRISLCASKENLNIALERIKTMKK